VAVPSRDFSIINNGSSEVFQGEACVCVSWFNGEAAERELFVLNGPLLLPGQSLIGRVIGQVCVLTMEEKNKGNKYSDLAER